MSKRNFKRSNIRKQQSEKDKLKFIQDQSSQYGKLAAFQHFLGALQHQDIQYHQYIKIPVDLIDLTAAFIASLISGNDYLLALPSPDMMTVTLDTYQANIKFINKTLTRAQVTYSSLIVCLWYIDQFFCRRRITHAKRKQSTRTWQVRDLFMASIIVADKYMADLTWYNADWADSTQYAYSCHDLNQLERRFLEEMDYSLFVSDQDYYNFCNYLEFRVHLRQINIGSRIMSLSYHNINVLSQQLNPIYVKRLGLSLRPFEAMILLAKTVTSICIMYAATIAATISTAYICYQYSNWLVTVLLEKSIQEHMVLMLVDILDLPDGLRSLLYDSGGSAV
ncbi:uncharacterized protein BX664DRAFT_136817 [Halteromyces radiatus]|uniref:uncharacterized protein n=1 Tax=Halteromyces radiatus TaxID=101107 RepID=UPI00221FB2B2|nr:uncharacterized protein BX664DRAFT_136817 [Halteromyces radiatus]KAI8089557.1 hypothetical protein BX664DRAFT_136817 [Halteromyces radiatus]